MLSQELLKIIACPACKGDLIPDNGEQMLMCRHCALGFPVREGIPVLLIDEAVKVDCRGKKADPQ
jgi:uncharacterized protein